MRPRELQWTSRVGVFILGIAASLVISREARAIDFYEIQIYDTDTAPVGHMELELHSNSVTTATGVQARKAMDVYDRVKVAVGCPVLLRSSPCGATAQTHHRSFPSPAPHPLNAHFVGLPICQQPGNFSISM